MRPAWRYWNSDRLLEMLKQVSADPLALQGEVARMKRPLEEQQVDHRKRSTPARLRAENGISGQKLPAVDAFLEHLEQDDAGSPYS